ncbi:DNA mismatch repair endonuclease MutL [Bythopirellula goksoeyrii]|uniref:DNA mismatch repair protein MutL n=1 Tax=Bythopirellula goksoeyrii TaxID=1400387 RepID=A0A5B9QGN0_9BACT|nr:DNA mismatch repair endonuclease MutL [Bythopirellula goksoeyrii]QEG36742.1 DNA mismatch repair protein MutL [Bythopirellula goksoeyrii]
MPTIRQLSSNVVNKIAAGEVIERPASVVKELVENSVDSGATRIDVTIEQGGVELVRVTDNGCGIAADQLQLAVASHATSKIADADDLFRVGTLGFRGEALASIAEVSRLVLRSRPADCEAGAELEIVGGRAEPIRPVGCPAGTTIEIRQLFFNTPVRHKFMRTTQTEMGHITEAITRLALAAPHVHFSLTHGGRLVHDLPPVSNLRERIGSLFGAELADGLIEIESADEHGDQQIRLSGYVANPSHSRGNNRLQYLILNGRVIRDRSLQHALGEAYRGLLLTGRYPICFLNLELSPSLVDVNVHPTKLEVRFQDGGRIYSQLLGTLRSKFLSTDLVARGSFPGRESSESGDLAANNPVEASELYAWAKNQLGRSPTVQSELTGFSTEGTSTSSEGLRLHDFIQPASGASLPAMPQSQDRRLDASDSAVPAPLGTPRALQIHNRYLVVENEDGLEVIDQHALHERILYEQLRDKVAQGELESQRLLVPEPVDLAGSEAAVLLENQALLSQLGLELEPFGGETVLVAAYPAMLANFSPREVLGSLVEQLQAEGKRPESRDLLDELMHTIACKAAIKFGDSLTPGEVEALLAQRHLAQDHHHCPHGRPTALVFTREQLDRQFKRI